MGVPRSPKCTLRGGLTRDEVKAAVRERGGGRCFDCGVTDEQHVAETGKRTEVHRVVPGSIYTVEGCVLLCRKCHGPQPKRKKGVPDLDADGARKAVQLPEDWHGVASRRAVADRPVSLVYYLIELIKRDAEEAGDTELPPVPWAIKEQT